MICANTWTGQLRDLWEQARPWPTLVSILTSNLWLFHSYWHTASSLFNMATLQVKLSLSSWEKELIRETKETFSEELDILSSQESPVSQEWIRENWGWATQVRDQLRDSCHDLEDEEESIHQSDPDRTWQVLKNKLSWRSQPGTSSENYSCLSRTKLLLDANDSLQSFICQQQLPSIAPDCIQLTEDDGKDWEAIWNFSKFIKTNHPRLHGLQCSNDTLKELEQLFSRLSPPRDDDERSSASHAESQSSSEASGYGTLCEYPAFEVHSMVQTVASYYRQAQLDFPQELQSLHGVSWSSVKWFQCTLSKCLISRNRVASLTSWNTSQLRSYAQKATSPRIQWHHGGQKRPVRLIIICSPKKRYLNTASRPSSSFLDIVSKMKSFL